MWTKEELNEIAGTWKSKRENWIGTFTGKRVNFADPQKDMFDIVDIAHALGHSSRFNGHISEFYSVAQHSVLVYYIVTEMGGTLEERMQALLHDAVEAYVSDIPAPLKDLTPMYQKIEKRVAKVIGEQFGVDLVNLPDKVKEADVMALAIEAHQFFDNIDWIDPVEFNRTIPGVTGQNGELIASHPSIGKNAFMNEYWNLKLKLDKERE